VIAAREPNLVIKLVKASNTGGGSGFYYEQEDAK
jgi:hypothetical protein